MAARVQSCWLSKSGAHLRAGCVGEHELAIGVADAEHVRDGLAGLVQHPHVVVHGDEAAAVCFCIDSLQVEALHMHKFVRRQQAQQASAAGEASLACCPLAQPSPSG